MDRVRKPLLRDLRASARELLPTPKNARALTPHRNSSIRVNSRNSRQTGPENRHKKIFSHGQPLSKWPCYHSRMNTENQAQKVRGQMSDVRGLTSVRCPLASLRSSSFPSFASSHRPPPVLDSSCRLLQRCGPHFAFCILHFPTGRGERRETHYFRASRSSALPCRNLGARCGQLRSIAVNCA